MTVAERPQVIPEYSKINTIWKRDDRGRILIGEFSTPELEYLASLSWEWTEKVDGTNIRLSVVRDNGAPRLWIGGRTDAAQIPSKLIDAVNGLLTVEAFLSAFGDEADEEYVLYGEGYGAGIQKGGVYRPDMSFVLFDVKVGPWWLKRSDVVDVGKKLELDVVPIVATAPLVWAHHAVRDGELRSTWNPEREPEGLVGRPSVDLFDRRGDRVLAKIKAKDFKHLKGEK